ncbi:MAG TPA: SGNH/GDSL hydrolase family protein [Gemmatimonadaceae bacterium]|jgi:lysophospholipase L1-like esterase|nr:SGNH/GDSL hydrolase family protein [Gemmatimonadaceae bacterium]
MTSLLTRREFAAAAASTLAMACTGHTQPEVEPRKADLAVGTRILFQGDSITDAGRDRSSGVQPNVASGLGTGYPLLLAAAMLESYSDRRLQFFNRGVSGNKVPDLEARWQEDTIALQPDIVSVLVGVNDFWHKRTHGYTGTVADFENGYVTLLEQTRQALPHVRLVVMEPFVLQTGAVDATWFPEFEERRAVASRVAQRVGATFVPLQARFTSAAERVDAAYWIADGVHPTPPGHALIAEGWRASVGL